jgi:DNA-binding Lrp family transcriptional regulator
MSAPQAASNTPIELDEIDQRIIDLLRQDGRQPYRALARELDLTESMVRARVKRLEESNTMRVVAVTDFEAAGYEMLLAIGVQVEGRSPVEVANDLAKFPEIFSINVVIGSFDIELLVVAEDQAAMTDLISNRIAGLPGVRRILPSLALDVVKNQPDWVPFHD